MTGLRNEFLGRIHKLIDRGGDNLTHQVWFDDHETLAVKYAAALKGGGLCARDVAS